MFLHTEETGLTGVNPRTGCDFDIQPTGQESMNRLSHFMLCTQAISFYEMSNKHYRRRRYHIPGPVNSQTFIAGKTILYAHTLVSAQAYQHIPTQTHPPIAPWDVT